MTSTSGDSQSYILSNIAVKTVLNKDLALFIFPSLIKPTPIAQQIDAQKLFVKRLTGLKHYLYAILNFPTF